MSYVARVYKVMIASPSDVAAERSVIREVLYEWNIVHSDARKAVLLPIGWETHSSPTMGDSPQSIINRQVLKDADLLVGVFWTRIGTATGEYVSGTVEEIEKHHNLGKPVMLYFSDQPVHPASVDQTQYLELQRFKESCKHRGIFETYYDLRDFKDKFYRQLQLKLNKEEYFKRGMDFLSGTGDESQSTHSYIPEMTREAQTLLKEASQDRNGIILCVSSFGGLSIQTNGKGFVEKIDARSRAVWEGALEELEREDLIRDKGSKREVFGLTRRGYEVAEILNP